MPILDEPPFGALYHMVVVKTAVRSNKGEVSMNIALFLTPKKDVVTLHHHFTIEEAMDVLQEMRYSSVPVIDSKGRYMNSISEGDILWYLKSQDQFTIKELAYTSIRKIKRHHEIKPVSINSDMDSLIDLVAVQSFVPVVDDDNVFIGIIKRSDIINYSLSQHMNKKEIMVS